MTFGFLVGSKNFCKLFSVHWEVFFLHGYDWIHWDAKSCTTTAYRSLLRGSHPSLRTLWSAVIKSPKISARRVAVPVRFLQGALVILVFMQMSQFSVLREVSVSSVLTQYHFSHRLWSWLTNKISRVRPCVLDLFRFLWFLPTILTDHATGLSVPARCPHFYMCFRFLLVLATGLSVLGYSCSHFVLTLDAM